MAKIVQITLPCKGKTTYVAIFHKRKMFRKADLVLSVIAAVKRHGASEMKYQCNLLIVAHLMNGPFLT